VQVLGYAANIIEVITSFHHTPFFPETKRHSGVSFK
jgi:hypothetical protein